MKKARYLKQFTGILADLRLEVAKRKMTEYDYYVLFNYIIKTHNLMNDYSKSEVFRAMYLALSENTYIRSRYEVYAYKLVAERFRKYKVLKLCVRWLYDTKNRF